VGSRIYIHHHRCDKDILVLDVGAGGGTQPELRKVGPGTDATEGGQLVWLVCQQGVHACLPVVQSLHVVLKVLAIGLLPTVHKSRRAYSTVRPIPFVSTSAKLPPGPLPPVLPPHPRCQ
jgi:hypothetical protein